MDKLALLISANLHLGNIAVKFKRCSGGELLPGLVLLYWELNEIFHAVCFRFQLLQNILD